MPEKKYLVADQEIDAEADADDDQFQLCDDHIGGFKDGGDHESLKNDSEEISGLCDEHTGGFGLVTMKG